MARTPSARLAAALCLGTALAAQGLVKDIHSGLDLRSGSVGSEPSRIVAAGDRLFFIANDGSSGAELWVSDGTVAGTALARDIYPGPGSGLPGDQLLVVGQDRTVLFAATDGSSSLELWRSDGTAQGTVLVADLVPGPRSALPQQFRRAGSNVFFLAWEPAPARSCGRCRRR